MIHTIKPQKRANLIFRKGFSSFGRGKRANSLESCAFSHGETLISQGTELESLGARFESVGEKRFSHGSSSESLKRAVAPKGFSKISLKRAVAPKGFSKISLGSERFPHAKKRGFPTVFRFKKAGGRPNRGSAAGNAR
jgi:hypothetical protein